MNSILIQAIDWFFQLLNILILIRVLLSWFPISPNNPFLTLLYQLTEPILGPIRYLLEKSIFGGKGMMLDFSPLIAMLVLQAIRSMLIFLVASLVF
ncbi:MAG: YggT family protein [Epulopiscium sp.]|nr:YggT family protein [Candidatus Epulonipiscium sp.]